MLNICVFIDADSCPVLVRNHTIKICNQLHLPVYVVANKNIPCDNSYTYNMIICEETKDSADNYILEHSKVNDIVITKDIVFANKLVEKNVRCLNDRGTIFTKENIKELLSERDFNLQLYNAGAVKRIYQGYNKKQFALFANCFDKVIHQSLTNI